MTNSSASGGYLAPTSAAPPFDDPFDQFLHDVIVGITGLAGNLVMPRWQPVIPRHPEVTVNWCAVGVLSVEDVGTKSQVTHNPAGTIVAANDGSDIVRPVERVISLVSMYGPAAWGNIGLLRDGLRVEQNRAALRAAGVGLESTGPRRVASDIAPQLVARRRVDMELVMVRLVSRTYPVYNLLSAQSLIHPN